VGGKRHQRVFGDVKDDLETDEFTNGTGVDEPKGGLDL
jgi:hypothetical protein